MKITRNPHDARETIKIAIGEVIKIDTIEALGKLQNKYDNPGQGQ